MKMTPEKATTILAGVRGLYDPAVGVKGKPAAALEDHKEREEFVKREGANVLARACNFRRSTPLTTRLRGLQEIEGGVTWRSLLLLRLSASMASSKGAMPQSHPEVTNRYKSPKTMHVGTPLGVELLMRSSSREQIVPALEFGRYA